VVDDEKKVLIDLAKAIKTDDFLAQIAEVTSLSELDYVVVNHMEPDHTGILRTLKQIAPQVTFICTPKARQMLAAFYGISENVMEVEDGHELNTGTHTLRFVHTPFVHWPETMMTYETTQRILFSCDGFGGYGALRGAIFDDQCTDHTYYERESLRYFVNIVAKFCPPVLKAIGKLSGVDVSVVAPSHGLVWRKNPARIIELYRTWAGHAQSGGGPGVTLVYGSMYGNTEAAMNAVGQGLSEKGVAFEVFDAARTHASYILPSLWVRKGIMIGAPTYEGGMFPPVMELLNLAAAKAVRHKKVALFGSYGWSGGAQRQLDKLAETAKWEVAGTLLFQGGPTPELLGKARQFGQDIGPQISQPQ
jgi:flavorubredoxin